MEWRVEPPISKAALPVGAPNDILTNVGSRSTLIGPIPNCESLFFWCLRSAAAPLSKDRGLLFQSVSAQQVQRAIDLCEGNQKYSCCIIINRAHTHRNFQFFEKQLGYSIALQKCKVCQTRIMNGLDFKITLQEIDVQKKDNF